MATENMCLTRLSLFLGTQSCGEINDLSWNMEYLKDAHYKPTDAFVVLSLSLFKKCLKVLVLFVQIFINWLAAAIAIKFNLSNSLNNLRQLVAKEEIVLGYGHVLV